MNCLYCGQKITNNNQKFCCREHCSQYRTQQKIKDWLNGVDEGWTGTGIKSFVRKYLLERANYKCELCGWGEKNPYSGLIPLEIHHKDGNYKNNKLDNVQVLCPNCHSLTDTYKSMNQFSTRERYENSIQKRVKNNKSYCIECGKEITLGSTRCFACEMKNRIIPLENMPVTREKLKELIRTMPFTKIGEKYNVTDNAIRKWCDKFNLPRKVADIKAYTDEEWEKI